MLSSSEPVSWDQEKGQWHRPKERGEEVEKKEEEEGATRDSVCECSSTLPE